MNPNKQKNSKSTAREIIIDLINRQLINGEEAYILISELTNKWYYPNYTPTVNIPSVWTTTDNTLSSDSTTNYPITWMEYDNSNTSSCDIATKSYDTAISTI